MSILRLVVFLSLFLSSSCLAICEERKAIIFGGWSNHFISNQRSDGQPWNEDHNVLSFECNDLSLSSFTNSWGEESYAVGWDFPIKAYSWVNVELYTGVWTGYHDIIGGEGLLPVVSPKATISIGNFEVIGVVNPVVSVLTLGIVF